MSAEDDGGPAFPAECSAQAQNNGHQTGHNLYQQYGMSLRDYFAAKAMQSILTALREGIRPDDCIRAAEDSYFMADAMLKARHA